MAINRETFINKYLEELSENLEGIDRGIITLKNDSENEEVLNSILRYLHTIKGSSRMLRFNNIEKISY